MSEFAGSGLTAVIVWAGKQVSTRSLNTWEVFGIVEITGVCGDGSLLHTLGCRCFPLKDAFIFPLVPPGCNITE